MYNNITECMVGGGVFGAYIRVDFLGETPIVKRAVISEKDFTDSLFVSKYITLTESEIGGKPITRVGLTDCEGGEVLMGGKSESVVVTGENERTVTFTLQLDRPNGWNANEKFFDMLTGTSPITDDFAIRPDDGESVGVTPVITDGKLGFYANLGECSRVTLMCGGKDALTLYAPVSTVTETVSREFGGEYYGLTTGVRSLVSVTCGGENVAAQAVLVPVALGEEVRLPIKFDGRMSAFGDCLALINADRTDIYGAGFTPLSSRSGEGITDVSVTESGAYAVADSKRIRVCRGFADICELPVAATGVLLTESGNSMRLHYLSGGRLVGADITKGVATQVYSTESDCVAIIDRGDCVLGISSRHTRLYSADGAHMQSYWVNEGTTVAVVGKSRGMFALKTSGRYWFASAYSQRGVEGDIKALSGRIALTNFKGATQIVALSLSSHPVICVIDADDLALTDRLYYRRGDAMYYREPKSMLMHIIADGADGDITAEMQADGLMSGDIGIELSLFNNT